MIQGAVLGGGPAGWATKRVSLTPFSGRGRRLLMAAAKSEFAQVEVDDGSLRLGYCHRNGLRASVLSGAGGSGTARSLVL
jgi:hypothetical protein